jgi:hypothetical protein
MMINHRPWKARAKSKFQEVGEWEVVSGFIKE